ncbi:MAG: leucine-rich repeat domain-containing protein [bacterium]
MKHGEEVSKKERARRRKKALRLRRGLAAAAGLLAAVLLVVGTFSAPGMSRIAWIASAAVLGAEAILLGLRKPLPATLYAMIAALCLALAALGMASRGYVATDGGIVPTEALETELRVTNRWPDDIDRYTGLTALDMRGSTVTDFSPLLLMRRLRALDIRGNAAFDQNAHDAIAAALPDCDILWSVNIAGQYYDSDTTSIDLTGSGLDFAEIAALQDEYPNIEFDYAVQVLGKTVDRDATELDLRGAAYVDPDEIIAALNLLPNVRRVNLEGTPVSINVVEALKNGCPADVAFTFTFAIPGGSMGANDETVILPGGTYDDLMVAMAFIPHMPRLKYMDARAIIMNTAEQRALRENPYSERILYNFTLFGKSVNILTTTVNLDNNAIQGLDGAEAILAALPNLTEVSMVNCGLSTADMMALCDAHPQIRFTWVVEFGKYKLRTDATAFTTNLYANNKEHYTSQTFAPLRYCTELMMLDLGHCDITDISFIAGMKHLKVLILADNDITDISALADKDELEYVELFLNKIGDLTPLANKPRLLDLNIYYNPVRDLSPLATDAALERLWLGECGLTGTQINAIRQALPKCKVNAKGSASTGRGWRDHKRYKTLREMYRQGIYIPFG